jgi:hypothetical protein
MGMIIFTKYEECDPLTNNQLEKGEQVRREFFNQYFNGNYLSKIIKHVQTQKAIYIFCYGCNEILHRSSWYISLLLILRRYKVR